jgi:hypothetical protein
MASSDFDLNNDRELSAAGLGATDDPFWELLLRWGWAGCEH